MQINGKKITGLKKSVGDYNNWQGCCDLVLNKDTGELITFLYNGPTEPHYIDSIIILETKAFFSMWERDNKTSMQAIKEKIAAIIKEVK